MADEIQLRGGSEAENDSFTGAQREVTVDTTNKTLRVHDGTTAGGSKLATQDYVGDNTASLTVENESGTSYTVVAADSGKVKRFTDASQVTVTLPDGLAVGTIVHLLSAGAGGLSIESNASSTVDPNDPGTVDEAGEASALVVATDTWNVQGTA
ncbi:MAG: hypothetical protein WD061_01960 [Candidatus Saccharimonadales bacterium]